MSKETRTVRPFVGIDPLSRVLDETLLHFGQQTCLANHGITIEGTPHEFLLRPVWIEWGSDAAAFESFKARVYEGVQHARLRLEDLALVVVGSTSFLKEADIVFRCGLAELGELERLTDLAHAARPRVFSAPHSGFSVDTYLLLERSLEPELLRPSLKGTWLASAQFRIGSTDAPALLPPTPLTDEVREQRGLLRKTIRYVYFGDHDVLQPYSGQEQPTFYVDDKLLAQMNARQRSAASKAVQIQLAQDFADAVIRRASRSSELRTHTYDDVRSSLLGSVLRIAAGPSATTADLDALVDKVVNDPDYVIARTEHFIDVASAYSGILEESNQ
jgi:hypothetical protein